MKKRLLSLVLCLVMVFSLLPTFALTGGAVDRAVYTEVTNQSWTTDTNYSSYGDLYVLRDGEYYKVKTDPGYLYSLESGHDWKLTNAPGKYYRMSDTKFGVVQTGNGYLYTKVNNKLKFRTELRADDNDHVESFKDTYGVYTNFFYKLNDTTYGRVYTVILAHSSIWAWDAYFKGYLYCYNANDGQDTYPTGSDEDGEIGRVGEGNAAPNAWLLNVSKFTNITSDSGNGEYIRFIWGGDPEVSGTFYTRDQGNNPNHLEYDTSGAGVGPYTQLPGSSLKYENNTNPTLYTQDLYSRTGSGAMRLYYEKDGNKIDLDHAASQIKGTEFYHGKLYQKTPKYDEPVQEEIIDNEDEAVVVSKNLSGEKADGTYDLTMTAYTTGNKIVKEQSQVEVTPLDIAIVVDQSSSMATADMDGGYAPVTEKTSWTVSEATSGTTYYAYDGTNYYPIKAKAGTVFTRVEEGVRASDMFGYGHDAISLGVNGAPTHYNVPTDYYVQGSDGRIHRLYLITAGLFLNYGLYPYYYYDQADENSAKEFTGNNYWVAIFDNWDGSDLRDTSRWNTIVNGGREPGKIAFIDTNCATLGCTDSDADDARLSYSWITSSKKLYGLYQKSETQGTNQLYYVDNAGREHLIGSEAQLDGDVVYTYPQNPSATDYLYAGNGMTRRDALIDAVSAFTETVKNNSVANNVDHRIALIGFAGNKVPYKQDGPTAFNTTPYDYTNTGLFLNEGSGETFKNYMQTSVSSSPVSTRFINCHYYIAGNIPVKYNTTDGTWYRVDNNNTVSGGSFYEPEYTSLTVSDYQKALVSVNQNGAVNGDLTAAISQFGANGRTYTSYGVAMAKQLFANTDGTGRQRVIIIFTDGEPGSNGYESSIAGEALVDSNQIKASDGNIAIYTVGLFTGSPSSQVESFMKQLSSEYSAQLKPVNGGASTDNYGLGSDLNANKTYYYFNENGKALAVTTDRYGSSSLGWWIDKGGVYVYVTPKTNTGAGTTVFYSANGSEVKGDNVQIGTTYYDSSRGSNGGNPIRYEYRWYDSDRNIVDPIGTTSVLGEYVQFFELGNPTANADGKAYYMTASNAADLNGVFSTIANTVTTVTEENSSVLNDDNTYLMDEITADFDLPNSPISHVSVYKEPALFDNEGNLIGFDSEHRQVLRDGTLDQIKNDLADVSVSWQGKKLTVRYYEFDRFYVRANNSDLAGRLVVVVDGLKPNKPGDPNDGWKLYSNTRQSGIYNTENDATSLLKPFEPAYAVVPGYKVVWKNSADVLETDEMLMAGTAVSYDGEQPVKEADEDYTYTFVGWATSDGQESGVPASELPAVPTNADSENTITYYAAFSKALINKYHVTWKMPEGYTMNGENVLYEDTNAVEGTVPEYAGELPAIANNGEYTYFFAGWSTSNFAPSEDRDAVAAAVTEILPVTGDVTYYAVFGMSKIPTKNYVVDYGVKHVLDTGVSSFDVINQPSGEFGLEEGSFSFTPKMNALGKYQTFAYTRTREFKVMDLTGMSKVNTAVYSKDDYTKVNVVAASSIYLDDSVTDVSATPYYDTSASNFKALNDQEYKAVLAAVGQADDDTAKVDSAQPVAFTFTGTGIEIYSKTAGNSGSLSVYLLDKEGKRFNVEGQKQGVRDISSENTTLYNVPVVKFYDLPSDTYTVVIMPATSGDFQLDGVRVFNANPDQQSKFLNVRESLLASNPLVDGEEALFDGVFFLIGKDPTNSVAEYKKSGPKNEVYLSAGESVAFIVPAGTDYRIGLSAVDGTPVSVKFTNDENAEATTVSSAIHMFYDIEPYTAADGSKMVMIKNVSGGILSVTDLQYTPARLGMFKVSRSLMNYVQSFDERTVVEPETVQPPEETTVPESPAPTSTPDQPDTPSDPTPTPGIGSWISQLFSNFVSSLFNSIARLFGGH